MQKTKTYTLIVRNVSKAQKDSLKRLAKSKNQSVNGYLLTTIGLETVAEITEHGLNKYKK